MSDTEKTKDQLIKELAALRGRVSALETLMASAEPGSSVDPGILPPRTDYEQHCQHLLEKHPDAITLVVNGRIVYSNPALAKMLGYAQEEMVGHSPVDYTAPEDHQRARDRIRDLLAGAPPGASEYHLIRKDGKRIPAQLHSLEILYRGHPTLLMLIQDISDRKEAERALRERETRLRLVTDQIPAVLWTTDMELRFTSSSGTALAALNITADEVIGQTLYEYFGTDDPEFPAIAAHRRAIAGESVDFEQEWRNHVFRCYVEPLRGASGAITGSVGIALNITERKKAVEALRRSEQVLRQLTENIREVFWLTDWTTRTVLYISPAYETIWGRSCQSLYDDARSWAESIHPEDRERVERAFDEKVELGLYDEEYRVVHADGSIRWIRDRGFPIHDREGNVCRMAGISEDITEHRKSEEQLSRARRLEAAGQFAGQVAHDFNNLLGALVVYPDLIRGQITTTAAVDQMLAEMKHSARQLAEINQQLLTLGRRGHYKTEDIHLNELLHETIRIAGVPDSVNVAWDLDDNVANVEGGRAQLGRMITNLVTNAIEAMDGIGTLTIRTRTVRIDHPLKAGIPVADDYVRIDVTDTGMGIPAQDIGRIFDPYFTTKPAERRSGSGLGLSVVRAVVEDHHGHVDVDSSPEHGTTFRILLPAQAKHAVRRRRSLVLPRGHGESVLVVDDDPLQLRIAERALTQLGYQPYLVSSGQDAVNRIKHHRHDVVLLDMVMEGMDGVATLEHINEINPQQRAILLSAYAPSDQVGIAKSLGAEAFLAKPVELSDLASALANVLQRRRP